MGICLRQTDLKRKKNSGSSKFLICFITSVCFFSLIFVLPAFAQPEVRSRRALFVSVVQDPVIFSSREEMDRLIDFSKKSHVDTLFVQVYRANKAWFPSKFADPSPYEECFNDISEDPFRLLIKKAHASGIEVHAWLNLLSLSANANAPILKKYGPEILTRNTKKKRSLKDYKIDDQYFLEPGDPRVREELSNIVAEIVQTYPNLDGMQFDYIRYPDMHPAYGYTKINMERFKQATGRRTIKENSPEWKRWKYEQVTGLLRALTKKIHTIQPDVQISTTGLMPYSRASLEAFQDWKFWLEKGLVDFVTLMCYAKNVPDFEKYIENAKIKTGDLKKVNIAVGAYALSRSPEIFQDQFKICEDSDPRSCVVLHYGSLEKSEQLAGVLLSTSDKR